MTRTEIIFGRNLLDFGFTADPLPESLKASYFSLSSCVDFVESSCVCLEPSMDISSRTFDVNLPIYLPFRVGFLMNHVTLTALDIHHRHGRNAGNGSALGASVNILLRLSFSPPPPLRHVVAVARDGLDAQAQSKAERQKYHRRMV